MLSNPTPDSFHLKQTAIIGNKSPYHPRLDAFNASLSLAGPTIKPYAYVEIPVIFASDPATTIIDQDVKITDINQFNIYTSTVLNNESISLAIHGKTGLHEMRFPTTIVDYNKVVPMKGQYLLPPIKKSAEMSAIRSEQAYWVQYHRFLDQAHARPRRYQHGRSGLHSQSNSHDDIYGAIHTLWILYCLLFH